MKKNKKIIKFLKSVKYDKYSKYSIVLEKMFHKKCVQSLIESLKQEKIITDEDIFNQKFEKKESPKKTEKNDDNQKNLLQYTYSDYIERQKEKEKIIIKNIKKIESWSIADKSMRGPRIKITFDSYKYHPNYNIRYKRVPSFSFVKSAKKKKTENEEIKIKICQKYEKSRNTLSDKKDKINKDLKIKTETDINNKNNQNKYFPYLTSIDYKYYKNKNKGDIKKRPISHDKNNHCFNFSHYTSRKPLITNLSNNFSYIKPYDYNKTSKKLVNYKKMISRNEKDYIYPYKAKTPSMWQYSPKYDYIEANPRKIYFDSKSVRETKTFNKLKKLKRAITSYDISSDYLSVDNSKLGKKENTTHSFYFQT